MKTINETMYIAVSKTSQEARMYTLDFQRKGCINKLLENTSMTWKEAKENWLIEKVQVSMKSVNKEKNKYLTVSIHLKVDGKIKRTEEKTYYSRGSETYCHSLENFAATIFMWDKIFSPHSTYAYDGLLQEMEKKLPKRDNETAESVFQKYWVNYDKTVNERFLKLNKGGEETVIYPAENDYLKHCIYNICEHLNREVLPVKYGFLHWFYKYIMHGSIDELKADIDNIPDEIKELVDGFIVEK